MKERPEITYEWKLAVARRLRGLTDEQLVASLDRLSLDWRDALTIFGNPIVKNIDCEMPNNYHQPDVTEKYVCGNLTNPHTFCVNHDLKLCPIDGTQVKKTTV